MSDLTCRSRVLTGLQLDVTTDTDSGVRHGRRQSWGGHDRAGVTGRLHVMLM